MVHKSRGSGNQGRRRRRSRCSMVGATKERAGIPELEASQADGRLGDDKLWQGSSIGQPSRREDAVARGKSELWPRTRLAKRVQKPLLASGI